MTPAGWKLVPIEPTFEMLAAAVAADREYQARMGLSKEIQVGGYDHYVAMLEAAPPLPGSLRDVCQSCNGNGGTYSGGPCAECYGQGTYEAAREFVDAWNAKHDKRCPAALNLSDPCNCGATSKELGAMSPTHFDERERFVWRLGYQAGFYAAVEAPTDESLKDGVRIAQLEGVIRRALSSLCGDYQSMAEDLRATLGPDYSFVCFSCAHEWEGRAPDEDCQECGTTNRYCAVNQP